jgi:hypothetical protein
VAKERRHASRLHDFGVLAKALGDPRVAATVDDPVVQAERAEMQQLYATEMSRLGALNESVSREQLAIMLHDDGDAAGFGKLRHQPGPIAIPSPDSTSTPPTLPQLTGARPRAPRAIFLPRRCTNRSG